MNERTGKLIAAGMILFVGCPCLGFAVMLAMSIDAIEPPQAVAPPAYSTGAPWLQRLADCARNPESIGASPRETRPEFSTYDCGGVPGEVMRVSGAADQWRWDVENGAPARAELGPRDALVGLVEVPDVDGWTESWSAIRLGPLSNTYLREQTREERRLVSVFSAAYLSSNPGNAVAVPAGIANVLYDAQCGSAPTVSTWNGQILGTEEAIRAIAHDPGSVDIDRCSTPIRTQTKCWASDCNVRARNALGALVLRRWRFFFRRGEVFDAVEDPQQ